MRKTQVWIAMGCCLLAVAQFAWGQGTRKPGLWETTTSMSFGGQQMPGMPPNAQMPQLPPGAQLPPGMQMPQMQNSPFAPRTMQVCVTQAMIDKFGGPSPGQPRNGDCKMTNISIKPNGMTATMVCTGNMNATGAVESTWTDASTTHTKVHMTGTMQMGQNSRPVDMTMDSTSVYKGPDCGTVKPFEMPTK
jgi:hypothetical protein